MDEQARIGDKVLPLAEAIGRHVRSGMTLHLAGGIGGPAAAICELLRHFRDSEARLTIVQSTVTGHALNLVHQGLVSRLICAVCAEIGSSARPSRVVQRALAGGGLGLENWSLLSLQQRLLAGAFALPFMPTNSLVGSDLARENAADFAMLDDPFGPGERCAAVRALRPDLSIVHGCIADPAGNTVLALPNGEDVWGALASREGALVTVERIVSPETLSRYASLVRIPAYLVKAVSVAPRGLHPYPLANPGVEGFESYGMDERFLAVLYDASRESVTLDGWLEEWVKSCSTHADYLAKLASGTPAARVAPGGGRALPAQQRRGGARDRDTADDMMLTVLAREIARRVRAAGHRTILAGAGRGAQAAFLAQAMLRDEGLEVDMVTGNGVLGFTPHGAQSILSSDAALREARMLTDTVVTQGVIVGGAASRCLSVIGAGQISRFGDINSSRTSDGAFLVGSGGANDALNAPEVIVVLTQSRERFVETLPYVTGRGQHVTTVVSSMGVYRRQSTAGPLQLTGCFATLAAPNLEGKIAAVREECGWPLEVVEDVEELPAPTARESLLLQRLREGDVS